MYEPNSFACFLSKDFTKIISWYTENNLILNYSKTQLIRIQATDNAVTLEKTLLVSEKNRLSGVINGRDFRFGFFAAKMLSTCCQKKMYFPQRVFK